MVDKFPLNERTAKFAEDSRDYFNKLPKTQSNLKYADQGIRSTGSTAGNYIEANEALSKKDFYMRIKICKKEAKETLYWLELLGKTIDDEGLKQECRALWSEAKEFVLIFGKIVSKNKV